MRYQPLYLILGFSPCTWYLVSAPVPDTWYLVPAPVPGPDYMYHTCHVLHELANLCSLNLSAQSLHWVQILHIYLRRLMVAARMCKEKLVQCRSVMKAAIKSQSVPSMLAPHSQRHKGEGPERQETIREKVLRSCNLSNYLIVQCWSQKNPPEKIKQESGTL